MDNITKAGLLLNAVRAPYTAFKRLCSDYDPAELWQSESLRNELGLAEKMIDRLSRSISQGWAEKEDELIYSNGAKFITSQSLDYPTKLLDLKKPPIGLYIKGNANLFLPSVAIVGTRGCSEYARDVAENLGKVLAKVGIITVSGGAKGIDTAGHRGTLAENGTTVVIFGTGLDKIYPVENRDLFARILERGAWVSEYPFRTDGNTWRFPERDRLIAAISAHTVVAESPEDGGAMHTAKIAKGLGRDLWSIPGRIIDYASKGTNLLIRDGSKVFVTISDFVSTITEGRENSIDFDETNEASGNERPEINLSDDEKVIYSLIQRQGGRTSDEIVTESGLDFVSVNMALMNLEGEGLIADMAGRYTVLE